MVSVMNTYMFLELNGSTFRSSHLGGTILDAVSTVYSADDANYFLLESQNTLPQVNINSMQTLILKSIMLLS